MLRGVFRGMFLSYEHDIVAKKKRKYHFREKTVKCTDFLKNVLYIKATQHLSRHFQSNLT